MPDNDSIFNKPPSDRPGVGLNNWRQDVSEQNADHRLMIGWLEKAIRQRAGDEDLVGFFRNCLLVLERCSRRDSEMLGYRDRQEQSEIAALVADVKRLLAILGNDDDVIEQVSRLVENVDD